MCGCEVKWLWVWMLKSFSPMGHKLMQCRKHLTAVTSASPSLVSSLLPRETFLTVVKIQNLAGKPRKGERFGLCFPSLLQSCCQLNFFCLESWIIEANKACRPDLWSALIICLLFLAQASVKQLFCSLQLGTKKNSQIFLIDVFVLAIEYIEKYPSQFPRAQGGIMSCFVGPTDQKAQIIQYFIMILFNIREAGNVCLQLHVFSIFLIHFIEPHTQIRFHMRSCLKYEWQTLKWWVPECSGEVVMLLHCLWNDPGVLLLPVC